MKNRRAPYTEAMFCWVASLISFSWMYRACVKSGGQRLTSSLFSVCSNSCNCIWLRMRCVLIWGSTWTDPVYWSLWRKTWWELEDWVHWHFWKSINPGRILWPKSCSYSAAQTVLPQFQVEFITDVECLLKYLMEIIAFIASTINLSFQNHQEWYLQCWRRAIAQ